MESCKMLRGHDEGDFKGDKVSRQVFGGITVRAGSELVAALEARGIATCEDTSQLVDAVLPSGTGVVFLSSSDLAHMSGLSGEKGGSDGKNSKTSGAGGLKGWLKGPEKSKHQGDKKELNFSKILPEEEACQRAKQRVDVLQNMSNGGVLLVQREKIGGDITTKLLAQLQLRLSVLHTPAIPVLPINDFDSFITFLVMRSKCPGEPAKSGAHMSTVPKGGKGEPTGATITDKRIRTMLTALPGVNDPMAHQLLSRFKTLSGVLSAEEAQLAAMSSIKPEHARRLFRLFQCVRGHSTYS
jgi:hypothetical protein